MALVEFDDPRAGLLVAGQFVVFYNRQLDKGKVLGSALIEVGGTFTEFSYNTLPENKEGQNEDDDEDDYDKSSNNLDRMGL